MNRGVKTFLLVGLTCVGLVVAAPVSQARSKRPTPPAPRSNGLRYYGGPVVHSVNVVLVFWGAGARSAYTDPSSGDPAFFTYLAGQSGATSDIGGGLAHKIGTHRHKPPKRVRYRG